MVEIYLQMWIKLINIWWPVLLFIAVGLAVLAADEKKQGGIKNVKD